MTANSSVGILAGMRPCGVIVLLSELFIAESTAQVYGCLHNYFASYPNAANQTGQCMTSICTCTLKGTYGGNVSFIPPPPPGIIIICG